MELALSCVMLAKGMPPGGCIYCENKGMCYKTAIVSFSGNTAITIILNISSKLTT